MLRLSAALVVALSLPAVASSPTEGKGAEPRPAAGTGAGAALATGMTAKGSHSGVTMTYEVFEATVPHADLADCPIPLLGDGRFCRLGIAGEDVAVFVFSEEGDQPMIEVRTWPADSVLPLLN